MKTLLVASLLLVLVVGATILSRGQRGSSRPLPADADKQAQTQSDGSAQQQSSETRTTSLGHLETRHRLITVYAGARATYTVTTKDGKILAENISVAQLRTQFPDLKKVVDSGIAVASDASLNLNRSAAKIIDASP
jgi:hypothetical protein